MTRRRAWTLLGHSNGEGVAGSSPMLAAAPHLATRPSPDVSFYQNIKVFTTSMGWMVGTTNPSPPFYPIGTGAWLDMTMMGTLSPADANHRYSSPWNYPNTRSIPVTPDMYRAVAGFAGDSGGGWTVGVEVPLSWHLGHEKEFADGVYFVKLAIPGSQLLRRDQGLTSLQPYGWWTPIEVYDWHPTTGRLYQAWKDKMTGAAAALTAGDKLDVRLVVLWLGENDTSLAVDRIAYFEDAYKALMDKVRTDLVANDWTALPKHKIPIVMMGIYPAYAGASGINHNTVNAIFQEIQDDDPWAKWVDTTDFENLQEAGYTDPALGPGSHFSHNGYLDAAEAIYEAYTGMLAFEADALGDEDRLSVEDVRDRVRNYYERGRVRTDATNEIVDQHVNGALFHVLNRVGDNAWWLRRITQMAITASPTAPFTLPKKVDRLLRIERTADPGYPLKYEMLGFTERGRMQVLMREAGSGTYNVHYISMPRELTRGEELIPLPYNLIEWLIVEACRRLARASGNLALHESLRLEADALAQDAMRNMGAVNRARMDRMHSARSLPTRKSTTFRPRYDGR